MNLWVCFVCASRTNAHHPLIEFSRSLCNYYTWVNYEILLFVNRNVLNICTTLSFCKFVPRTFSLNGWSSAKMASAGHMGPRISGCFDMIIVVAIGFVCFADLNTKREKRSLCLMSSPSNDLGHVKPTATCTCLENMFGTTHALVCYWAYWLKD